MRWIDRALALALAAGMAASAPGQVVISQVDGSGGLTTAGWPNPYDRDFVELFNRGSTPVNLAGWSLQLWGDTGTSTAAATPSWDVILLSGTILPGQYFLVAPSFQRGSLGAAVSTPPLPAPDVMGPVYDGAVLVTSINAVALMSTTAQIPAGQCPSGPNLVDLFRYAHPNGLCFEGAGAAPPNAALGLPQAVHRNGGGCTDTNNSFSDITVNLDPTPRNSETNVFVTTALSVSTMVTGTGGVSTLTATRGASPCNPLPGVLTSAQADLSAFGLSATQQLFDDASNGDLFANDGVFSFEFTVGAGQAAGTYVIPVTGTSGATSLPSSARLRVFPTPAANDLCVNAINLSDPSPGGIDIIANGPYTTVVNNSGATGDLIDAGTCNGDTEVKFSVWYVFTPSIDGALRITESSTEDVVFSVHATCGAASSQCMNRESSGFRVSAGTTYYVQVGRETGATQTPQVPLVLTFEHVPTVANDTPCTAEAITSFPFSAQAYAPAAKDETFNIACDAAANPGARHGLWYSFVPTVNGVLEIYENSINPTNFVLFGGPNCATIAESACRDETLNGAIIGGLVGGTTYWLLVSYDAAATTSSPSQPYDFTINFLPAPVNDECAGAVDLNVTGLPFAQTVLARAASTDSGAPSGTGGTGVNGCSTTLTTRNAGVWYTYTTGPVVSGTLRVADFSAQDVFYNVFTGVCGLLTVDQCYGAFTADDIFIQLAPNTTYYILVSLQSTTAGTLATGSYDLTFTLHPRPTNDQPCGATFIDTLTFTDLVPGPSATADVDVSCNYTNPVQSTTGYGVWYRFAPSSPKQLTARQRASDVLVYGLFRGPNCSALSEVDCKMGNNGALTTDNTAYFNLEAGEEYWLLIGKIASSQPFGFYDLEFRLDDALGACCTAGGCIITTQAACNGQWRGAFTHCADTPQYVDAPAAAIPDGTTGTGGTPGLLTRTIVVPDSGTVSDLKLLLELSHARVGDLIITLTGPTGASVEVIRRIDDDDDTVCPNYGQQGRLTDLGATYIFDDQAYTPYGPDFRAASKYFDFTGLVVPAGHYKGAACDGTVPNLLAPFFGQTINGTWTLTITDNQSGSTGTLARWGLVINGGIGGRCACIADFNASGGVTVQDIFDFLTAYFSGSASADVNYSGGVTVQDIFDFLTLYFAGC